MIWPLDGYKTVEVTCFSGRARHLATESRSIWLGDNWHHDAPFASDARYRARRIRRYTFLHIERMNESKEEEREREREIYGCRLTFSVI